MYYERAMAMSLDHLFERDSGLCHLCLLPVAIEEAERDHVISTYHGGSDTDDNVALAHKVCNRIKSRRLPSHPEVVSLLT